MDHNDAMWEYAKKLHDECLSYGTCISCPVYDGVQCCIAQPCTWDFPYIGIGGERYGSDK